MKIGEIHANRNGAQYIIESKDAEKSDQKHIYYKIRFLESGFRASVRGDDITRGYVKDGLSKSCCGVGIIGYANTREHWHEYKIWNNMIHRCYDPNDKGYRYYGLKGVAVCERWKRFDMFLQDIRTLPGFDQTLFDNHSLKLDKDILSRETKIYSPETSMWVSDLENQVQRTKEYNAKHKKFAIFPDGHTEQILHVTNFCKEHGLHRPNVTACLSGRQKTHLGYSFYKEQ